MNNLFHSVFDNKKPIIGMVHLAALPGSPKYNAQLGWNWILERAMNDAIALIEGGVNGIQIENQFDSPYFVNDDIQCETVAFITAAACLIKHEFPEILMGIHLLLNGCCQAMGVAKAVGASWIRAFNLSSEYISVGGFVNPAGPKLMRFRRTIDADNVMVFGDFQVKHGSHAITSDRSLVDKALDVVQAGADALIITGNMTGEEPDIATLQIIKEKVDIPVLLGSGITQKNIVKFWDIADGAIIGSAFKNKGIINEPVSRKRVIAVTDLIR